MREQLFTLPDKSRGGLQAQVRQMLVSAILDGHIPPGAALPSCRKLARQLNVARNTVVLAYQQQPQLKMVDAAHQFVLGRVVKAVRGVSLVLLKSSPRRWIDEACVGYLCGGR